MDLNVLIVEGEEAGQGYEVVGIVSSREEAYEFAHIDLERRMRLADRDGDPGLCPYIYKMHARGQDRYEATLEILASDL